MGSIREVSSKASNDYDRDDLRVVVQLKQLASCDMQAREGVELHAIIGGKNRCYRSLT